MMQAGAKRLTKTSHIQSLNNVDLQVKTGIAMRYLTLKFKSR